MEPGRGQRVVKCIIGAAVFYLLLPNLLFLLGWVQWYWAVPVCILLVFSFFRILRCIPDAPFQFQRSDAYILPLLVAGAALCTECLGLHGHMPQTWDYVVRNPIYETLVRCDWPLYNAEGGYFVYYMAYWLPPALMSKVLGFAISPISILWIWNAMGVLLLLLTLWLRWRKRVGIILLLILAMGSLNDLRRIYGLAKWTWEQCPALEWIEPFVRVLTDWTNYFFLGLWNQIAINTPHTALPVCLVIAIVLSKRLPWRHIPYTSALAVLWSPLASACMLPWLMVYMKSKLSRFSGFIELFRPCSMWGALGLLCCVVMYFSCMESGMIHAVWVPSPYYNEWMKDDVMRVIKSLFITCQMLIPAFVFLGSKYKRTAAFVVSAALICFLPFVWVGYENNELLFKGSAVIMMLLVILYASRFIYSHGIWRLLLIAFVVLSAAEFMWDMAFRVIHKYTWSEEGISRNIKDEWAGHLNHPQHSAYKNFFGHRPCGHLLYSQSGESALHVLRPFASGKTAEDANPERLK